MAKHVLISQARQIPDGATCIRCSGGTDHLVFDKIGQPSLPASPSAKSIIVVSPFLWDVGYQDDPQLLVTMQVPLLESWFPHRELPNTLILEEEFIHAIVNHRLSFCGEGQNLCDIKVHEGPLVDVDVEFVA